MKSQTALFAALVLTLGSTMSAIAIQSDRDAKTADSVAVVTGQQVDSTQAATAWQATPAASEILILPRPL